MGLVDDVRVLGSHARAELEAAQDYYVESVSAWQVVQRAIEVGWTMNIRTISGTDIPRDQILARAERHIRGPLAEATFQQFLATVENFVFDLLRLWLFAYPRGLSDRKIDVSVVIESPDRDTILHEVINRELNDLAYKRPADWFAFIESRVHLGCPTSDDIADFAEAKATRDLLAHNRGVVNHVYRTKAGSRARFVEGNRVEIAEPYHRHVWNLCHRIVTDMCNAGLARDS